MYLYFCMKKQWEAGRDVFKEGGGHFSMCLSCTFVYFDFISYHCAKLCYCEIFGCFKIYVYLKDYLLLLTQHYL